MTKRDPFASRYDGPDTIGACGCSSIVGGLDLGVNIQLPPAAQEEVDALSKEADKLIGKAANAYAEAEAQVNYALEMGRGVEAAVKELDQTGNDIGNAILMVAANPLTHTALGALAAAAPPFSTALAGIGEVLVGVAAAAVPIVKALEDVFNDIFMSYEAKAAKVWGVTEEEAKRIIEKQKKRKEYQQSFAANQAQATTELANLRVKAAKGDKKAAAALAALDALMAKDTLLLTTILRFGCTPDVHAIKTKGEKTGLNPQNLCDIAKVVLEDQTRAATMSQADFEKYLAFGRGVTTKNDGKQTGYRFVPALDKNGQPMLKAGKPVMSIVDASTGKTIETGEKAVKEWQKGLDPFIDPKTRRVRLSDAFRIDFESAFVDSLFKNYEKMNAKSFELAETKLLAQAKSEADKKAREKVKKANLKALKKAGVPTKVGEVGRGIPVYVRSGVAMVGPSGSFRVIDVSEATPESMHYLILPGGRLVQRRWEEVT